MFSQIWRVFFFFNSSFFPLGKSSCNCSYNYHITIVIFLCSPPLCPYYFWQNLNTGTIWITFWSIFIFEWYLLLAEGQCECGKMVSWDDQVLLWFVISNILSRKSTLFFFFFLLNWLLLLLSLYAPWLEVSSPEWLEAQPGHMFTCLEELHKRLKRFKWA